MDFKDQLIAIASPLYPIDDPSHDWQHILRVLKNAEKLAEIESGDLEILIPAALFHDVVNYAKNDPKAYLATDESAEKVSDILKNLQDYPKEKIEKVAYCVKVCSFSKNIKAETLEAQILQDADMLESIGVISIMRTFASSALMKRRFFDPVDPFAENRDLDNTVNALDLFKVRLLKIPERMNTKTGVELALKRKVILEKFLEELRVELEMSDL